MASLVTGAAGAAIGSAFGPAGAQWGWAIGSTIGSMAFSSQPDQEGPRLNDLQIQDSSYGKPIPIVSGRDRLAGNIIWSKPLEEVKNEEEQGKGGGPTVTTYNYFATFALGLCEGEILGVRRIWIDSKLIYKYTSDATVEELVASNALIDGITVYTGSESQDPDPEIQAHKGAANTPAFRGLAYLLFNRLDVGNSGRIPNITVEVVSSGSINSGIREISSTLISGIPQWDYFGNGTYASLITPPQSVSDAVVINAYANPSIEIDSRGRITYEVKAKSPIVIANTPIVIDNAELFEYDTLPLSAATISPFTSYVYIDNPNMPYFCGRLGGDDVYIKVGTGLTIGTHDIFRVGADFSASSFASSNWYVENALIAAGATGEIVGSALPNQGFDFIIVLTNDGSQITNWYKLEGDEPASIAVTDSGTVAAGILPSFFPRAYHANGPAGVCSDDYKEIWAITSSEVISVLKLNSSNQYSRSSINPSDVSVAQGRTSAFYKDGIFGVIYKHSTTDDSVYVGYYTVAPVVSTTDVTLSTIVTDICERSGLSALDIDVSDLTDSVAGYTITRPMSARSAIQPLMMAYHFDGAEHSNKLNFVKRGGAVTLTVPEEDLGVDSDDLYSQTRQQEAELPSEVIINYKDVNRDFQPGSQRSRRINTNVENVRQIELPIAMSANKAKRTAEIIHYNTWVERDKFDIQVTDEYINLNPTDVIQFTENGRTRKGRIIEVPYSPTMKLEMVAESGVYTSDATAGESESVDQTIGIPGPTNLQLLDIPMLRNQDNDTAIYIAASGYLTGWSGCRVYKSSDDVSYSEIDAIFQSTTQGYTLDVLDDAGHTTWDRDSTVTVYFTSGSSQGSITEANALAGSRYFLIGSEIVIPVNETDNGDGTYTYDTFIRGRRGSDWATGSHVSGERVIVLNATTMSRIDMVLSTARYFKGVSIGNYLANTDSESFTNTGVSLKPFSPTFIRGSRDGSNNLTITWINRSRYIGGALQALPLFEESRIYKVEILDALGGSVLRTLSPNPTTESDTYSAADQVTDGFTAGDPIPVRISQYSATLGAFGYSKEAIV